MTALPIPDDLHETNTSFTPLIPGMQVAWDSTSLGTLKECPRKYYYTMVRSAAASARSIHLEFGAVYHKALEVYDHVRAFGQSHDKAAIEAVKRAMVDTWDADLRRSNLPMHSQKNRFTLVRTIVWYLEQFKDDPLKTLILANSNPAVELSFRIGLDYQTSANEQLVLCGHLDRAALDTEGSVWVVDRKTSTHTMNADYFLQYSPDNQMSLYDFAGQVVLHRPIAGIIVDAAQIAVTFSRFMRGPVPRTESQRDEWYMEQGFWFSQAEFYARRQSWPMNEKSCGNWGGCPFRELCSKPPSVREEWLHNGFATRVWDPLKVRGNV